MKRPTSDQRWRSRLKGLDEQPNMTSMRITQEDLRENTDTRVVPKVVPTLSGVLRTGSNQLFSKNILYVILKINHVWEARIQPFTSLGSTKSSILYPWDQNKNILSLRLLNVKRYIYPINHIKHHPKNQYANWCNAIPAFSLVMLTFTMIL